MVYYEMTLIARKGKIGGKDSNRTPFLLFENLICLFQIKLLINELKFVVLTFIYDKIYKIQIKCPQKKASLLTIMSSSNTI